MIHEISPEIFSNRTVKGFLYMSEKNNLSQIFFALSTFVPQVSREYFFSLVSFTSIIDINTSNKFDTVVSYIGGGGGGGRNQAWSSSSVN